MNNFKKSLFKKVLTGAYSPYQGKRLRGIHLYMYMYMLTFWIAN